MGEQKDWQQALHRQVLNALDGGLPERILVLDDTTWVGGTYRLALGLLQEAFPQTQARMIAADLLEWWHELFELWLADKNPGWDQEEYQQIRSWLHKVAPGSEDVDEENSLDWQPLTYRSKVIQDLSAFLPVDICLELPGWMEETITAEMHKRLDQDGGLLKNLDEIEPNAVSRPELSPAELVMKYVWQHDGKITRGQAARALDVPAAVAERILSEIVEQEMLLPQGRYGGAFYTLTPEATISLDQLPEYPLCI